MNHEVRGNGPTAVKSQLGYLLSGPANNDRANPTGDKVCAAMVDRNPNYPSADYDRSIYNSCPQNDYGRPSYDYNQPSYRPQQGQGYGQEKYDPPSQYQRAPHPPVKEEQANRWQDEVYRQEASPSQQLNHTETYDHSQVSQQLREERWKEYNYLKEANGTPCGPPILPVGLNIPIEAERHKIAELGKKLYREELPIFKASDSEVISQPLLDQMSSKYQKTLGSTARQQKEQILSRAQNQMKIPEIDHRQPYSDPLPPNTPPQDSPPSGRWEPKSCTRSAFLPVQSVTPPPHQANIDHDDYGQYCRQNENESSN